jgi:hypothetical protein
MSFYRDMTKPEAIEEIKRYPFQPILRPCSHTRNYPNIFAVTYTYKGRILHSLVERFLNGRYVEIQWINEPIYGTEYKDMMELEAFVKGLMEDEDPKAI